MASASDNSSSEESAMGALGLRRKAVFIPTFYIPMICLITLGLKRKPVLRDRLNVAVLTAAYAHLGYTVYDYFYGKERK